MVVALFHGSVATSLEDLRLSGCLSIFLLSGDRCVSVIATVTEPDSFPIRLVFPSFHLFIYSPIHHIKLRLINGLLLNFRLSGASRYGLPTVPARRGENTCVKRCRCGWPPVKKLIIPHRIMTF